MSDNRKSYIIAKESASNYGTGTTDSTHGNYYRPPAVAHITSAGQVAGGDLYETGNKMRVGSTYGAFTGQWQQKFVADYLHLEVFAQFFDTVVTIDSAGTSITDGYGDSLSSEFEYIQTAGTYQNTLHDKKMDKYYSMPLPPSGCYKHVFLKRNNKRVGNYVIREKQLNRIVGGEKDQQKYLYGAIPSTLGISRSSATSEMNCEMSGYFSKPHVDATEIDCTDWVPKDSTEQDNITQMSCMFMDSMTDDSGYVMDLDSHSISIENNTALIRNTCTKFAQRYTEGNCAFAWSAKTFHNEVTEKFARRYHSGGKDGSHNEPMNKGMAPMANCYFATFDGEAASGATKADTYRSSERSILFWFINSTVRGFQDPEGDNSLMYQTLSSVKADEMVMIAVNKQEQVWRDDDRVFTDAATPSEPNTTEREFTVTEYNTSGGSRYQKLNIKLKTYQDQALPILAYKKITTGTISTTEPPTIDGYVIVSPNLTVTVSSVVYHLYNLLSKQICSNNGVASNTGDQFTSTLGFTANVTGVTENSSTFPRITFAGTARYIGTEYFLIIKPGTSTTESSVTSTACDEIGYLRVDVVSS